MPARFTTYGIVLSARNQGERDRWVTLLTPEDGKISLLAKGVRTLQSKRGSVLQPGNIVKFSWITKGETRILTEATHEENLLRHHTSLDRIRDFSGILEILYHLGLEEIGQSEFYDSAERLLRFVGQKDEYHRGQVRQYLLNLAATQGIEAEEDSHLQSVSDLLEFVTGRKIKSFAYLRV